MLALLPPAHVIGTTLSVLGIFAIAAALGPLASRPAVFHLVWTLVAGARRSTSSSSASTSSRTSRSTASTSRGCRSRPGELSSAQGRAIVGAAGRLPLALALSQGSIETVAVAAALAIGWAYSCPPLHLKRFPVAASASISVVRSLVVNLGVYLHFAGAFGGGPSRAACGR